MFKTEKEERRQRQKRERQKKNDKQTERERERKRQLDRQRGNSTGGRLPRMKYNNQIITKRYLSAFEKTLKL